jgi:hypothetical protein
LCAAGWSGSHRGIRWGPWGPWGPGLGLTARGGGHGGLGGGPWVCQWVRVAGDRSRGGLHVAPRPQHTPHRPPLSLHPTCRCAATTRTHTLDPLPPPALPSLLPQVRQAVAARAAIPAAVVAIPTAAPGAAVTAAAVAAAALADPDPDSEAAGAGAAVESVWHGWCPTHCQHRPSGSGAGARNSW